MKLESKEKPFLVRIAEGDAAAVQGCIERYSALVWSLARSLGLDGTAAEDVVQEIFIELWQSAGRYDPERSSEANFIATIARRRLIDCRRRSSRRPQSEELDEAVATDDGRLREVEICDEAEQAQGVIRNLRSEQRRLLDLWISKGMTHRQIAQSTGMPLGTVKSHLRRALEHVRAALLPEARNVVGEVAR